MFKWTEAVTQLVGFIALFLTAGAVGFRFAALRGRRIESDRPFYDDAAQRAAIVGLVAGILAAGLAIPGIGALAARRHLTPGGLISSDLQTQIEIAGLAFVIIGYAIASARRDEGWYLAAIGVIGGTLRPLFVGAWTQSVNPIHSLAAGFWLGTLFFVVIAGITALLAHEKTRERRAQIAADMVNGFSPLALSMGGVVVLFGVITAWRHLHVLSALWTTAYGDALIVKLFFVALVFGLGAWNWQRQKPKLGTEPAAMAIRRSAAGELLVAAIVLIVTSVLVSIPSPRPQRTAATKPASANPGVGTP